MSTSLMARKNYSLVLPIAYVDIEQDEMEYIDGGFGPADVAVILTAYGLSYQGGYAAGKWCWYKFGTNASYPCNMIKIGAIAVDRIAGTIFSVGLDNGYYDTAHSYGY